MLHIEHPVRTATRLDDAMPIDMDATLFVALELRAHPEISESGSVRLSRLRIPVA